MIKKTILDRQIPKITSHFYWSFVKRKTLLEASPISENLAFAFLVHFHKKCAFSSNLHKICAFSENVHIFI